MRMILAETSHRSSGFSEGTTGCDGSEAPRRRMTTKTAAAVLKQRGGNCAQIVQGVASLCVPPLLGSMGEGLGDAAVK